MIFYRDGQEENISTSDFASMDLELAARYLESAAYAICPPGSTEGHVGIRSELETFLAIALFTGKAIDGARVQGVMPEAIIQSEPVQHNLNYMKTTLAPRLGEVLAGYETGHQGPALERSKMLASFVIAGTCMTLGGLLGEQNPGRLLGFNREDARSGSPSRTGRMSEPSIRHRAQHERAVVGAIPVREASSLTY